MSCHSSIFFVILYQLDAELSTILRYEVEKLEKDARVKEVKLLGAHVRALFNFHNKGTKP